MIFFIFLGFIFSIFEFIFKDLLNFDLITILIIEYSLHENNKTKGIIVSSIIGILQDLIIGDILFFNSFFKSLIFYLTFAFKEKLFLQSFVLKIISAIFFIFLQYSIKILLLKENFNLQYMIIILFLIPFSFWFISFVKKFIKYE